MMPRIETVNSPPGRPIDTGIPELNYVFSGREDGGILTKTLTGIFAEPQIGKTALSCYLAVAIPSLIYKRDGEKLPSLYIELEDFFGNKEEGVLDKYWYPLERRFGISEDLSNELFEIKVWGSNIHKVGALLGKEIKIEASGKKTSVTIKELGKAPLEEKMKEQPYSIIVVDGLHMAIKKAFPQIALGDYPARRSLQDAIFLPFYEFAVRHSIPVVFTLHGIRDPSKPFGGVSYWGGDSVGYAFKNLYKMTKGSGQLGSHGVVREISVHRSQVKPEKRTATIAIIEEWGVESMARAKQVIADLTKKGVYRK